jgi:hypothetical protein
VGGAAVKMEEEEAVKEEAIPRNQLPPSSD